MKFAHLADVHIGSWRDPKMGDVSVKAFSKAMDICVDEMVDFILIAGDLFNTSFPPVDKLKEVVKKLKWIYDKEIPVYLIAGSHDYSASGKTMLDVLEHAGLVKNVVLGDVVDETLYLRFTIDPKTGVKIAGMLGKKGALEKQFYEKLDLDHLEKEAGYKIFMYHSAVAELLNQGYLDHTATPLSAFPKGFNYYAGGHIHINKSVSPEGYGEFVYPGPIFPANFQELEQLKEGSFSIVEEGVRRNVPLRLYEVFSINVQGSTPDEIGEKIRDALSEAMVKDAIVLMRIEGTLTVGKPSDIDFKGIFEELYRRGVHFVMKNTNKLQSKEFEEVKVVSESVEQLEGTLIQEHMDSVRLEGKDVQMTSLFVQDLMKGLSKEKQEGETVGEFENRIRKDMDVVLRDLLD